MRAVRLHSFGDPDVLQIDDVPDPEPGAGQVVVRLHAVGVNPVETYIRSGIYGRPPTPLCLGNGERFTSANHCTANTQSDA